MKRKVDDFIKFPYTEAEARAAVDSFDDLGRFPQVIGAADGTHIPIKAPKDQIPTTIESNPESISRSL